MRGLGLGIAVVCRLCQEFCYSGQNAVGGEVEQSWPRQRVYQGRWAWAEALTACGGRIGRGWWLWWCFVVGAWKRLVSAQGKADVKIWRDRVELLVLQTSAMLHVQQHQIAQIRDQHTN